MVDEQPFLRIEDVRRLNQPYGIVDIHIGGLQSDVGFRLVAEVAVELCRAVQNAPYLSLWVVVVPCQREGQVVVSSVAVHCHVERMSVFLDAADGCVQPECVAGQTDMGYSVPVVVVVVGERGCVQVEHDLPGLVVHGGCQRHWLLHVEVYIQQFLQPVRLTHRQL